MTLQWPIWIGVVADDLQGQRRFYREVLEFEESEAGEDWIQFDLGSGRTLELLARQQDVPEYAGHGYVVGFEVEDIRAAAADLEARGVERVTDVLGGPESKQYWCYFRDGEGNLFEIAQKIDGAVT
jgi:catechol 2,3-dioxygenase-like lactoylglutathione lyase family enzyme